MAWCKTNASDFLKVVFFKSAWIFACANNSNIMKDAWSFYLHIDFANASVTDKDSFCVKKFGGLAHVCYQTC